MAENHELQNSTEECQFVSTQTANTEKGERTRRRIISAAMQEFGGHGFKGATTRAISKRAGLTLPSIQYYFGDKEGLYLACAKEVVAHYQRATTGLAASASDDLGDPISEADARRRLKDNFHALARLLIANPESRLWVSFVSREMREPGPAFDLMYKRLWHPGIELIAALIAQAQSQKTVHEGHRIDAMMLISSLMTFHVGQEVALRALQSSQLTSSHLKAVCSSLNSQIDRLTK